MPNDPRPRPFGPESWLVGMWFSVGGVSPRAQLTSVTTIKAVAHPLVGVYIPPKSKREKEELPLEQVLEEEHEGPFWVGNPDGQQINMAPLSYGSMHRQPKIGDVAVYTPPQLGNYLILTFRDCADLKHPKGPHFCRRGTEMFAERWQASSLYPIDPIPPAPAGLYDPMEVGWPKRAKWGKDKRFPKYNPLVMSEALMIAKDGRVLFRGKDFGPGAFWRR